MLQRSSGLFVWRKNRSKKIEIRQIAIDIEKFRFEARKRREYRKNLG